jgi:hypothetical protein
MADFCVHRIQVKREVTAVRKRIERVLGVTTHIEPIPDEWGGGWTVDFSSPPDVDLDFLRPDVLPPKPRS